MKTRDWLLDRLLDVERRLMDKHSEVAQLEAKHESVVNDLSSTREQLSGAIEKIGRSLERVEDLEFEIRELKRVPPIAPNLTVIENPSRKPMNVLSVASANGKTDITVARSKS